MLPLCKRYIYIYMDEKAGRKKSSGEIKWQEDRAAVAYLLLQNDTSKPTKEMASGLCAITKLVMSGAMSVFVFRSILPALSTSFNSFP